MALPDHYATLGILPNATEVSVKKAYRRLVLRFHPDRNPGDRGAEEQFKKVVIAYEILSRAEKRAEYDEQRKASFRSQQERAEAMRRQTSRPRQTARKPTPRRTATRASQLPYRSNEFDRRDVMQGLIWGACFLPKIGSGLTPNLPLYSQTGLLAWSLLPALGGFFGIRIGAWGEDQIEPHLVRLTIGGSLAYTLLPVFSPAVVLLCAGGLLVGAQHLAHATLVTDGVFGASLAAGLGAAIGGGFGRAFTSVAVRLTAKISGMLIGAIFGAGAGGLIGMFLGANQVGRWLDHGNYDTILTTILAAAAGRQSLAFTVPRGQIKFKSLLGTSNPIATHPDQDRYANEFPPTPARGLPPAREYFRRSSTAHW